MFIIQKESFENGGRPPIQRWSNNSIPDGFASIPDGFDLSVFYSSRGFVNVTIENNVLTGLTVNQEALSAYLLENPDQEENSEPSVDDDILETIIDHEIRLSELELFGGEI